MTKKPSKGSRPDKPTSPAVEPEAPASRTPETFPSPSRQDPIDTAKALVLARRWFPAVGIVAAIVLGFTHGVAVAVLVLAATAMLVAVGAIWASLQVLAGDRPESLDGAVQLMTSGGESEQKAFLLRALKDLEFERSLGKISDQDYDDMKARYRARAKEVLQELDKRNEAARAEAETLATEWLGSRGFAQPDRKPKPQEAARNDVEPSASPAERPACAACGTVNDSDARFCKKCGATMESETVDETAARSEES